MLRLGKVSLHALTQPMNDHNSGSIICLHQIYKATDGEQGPEWSENIM